MLRGGMIGLGIAAAALTAAPAMADGRRGPPPPAYAEAAYPSIWHGLYGGVHLGYGESGDADGIVGGVQLGYNWQSGRIVYGIEGDISASDISIEENFGPFHAEASIDWMATLRGRLGYLLTPNVLAYATAGFGIASGSVDANFPTPGLDRDDTETSFVIGLGVEGKITESMSARLEYLNFGDDVDVDVVRAGLNWKLGR